MGKLKHPPKPNVTHGWCILNSYGSVWHDEIFETPGQARNFITAFWKGKEEICHDFVVVEGKKTVEAVLDASYSLRPPRSPSE